MFTMTSNKICMTGILFYILPIMKYFSKRALIIFINGLFFHGLLANNKKMMFFDCICNFLICLYTAYFYPITFLPGLFFVCINIINMIYYNRYNINKKISNSIHIFACHFPFLYLIYITS